MDYSQNTKVKVKVKGPVMDGLCGSPKHCDIILISLLTGSILLRRKECISLIGEVRLLNRISNTRN